MHDLIDPSQDGSVEGRDEQLPWWLHGEMLVAAAGGGWIAVAIAILPSLGTDSALWLLLFLAAPFYEEALKPLGVCFVFLCWPNVSLSRLRIASLAAVGGLTFGLVESWLYVDAYPEGGAVFVLFRFTAPVAMHIAASFIFGLGLTPTIFGQLWSGRVPGRTRQAYLTAVGIHAAYNLTVLLLAVVGARELAEQTSP